MVRGDERADSAAANRRRRKGNSYPSVSESANLAKKQSFVNREIEKTSAPRSRPLGYFFATLSDLDKKGKSPGKKSIKNALNFLGSKRQ
jgi:hypothetical protein